MRARAPRRRARSARPPPMTESGPTSHSQTEQAERASPRRRGPSAAARPAAANRASTMKHGTVPTSSAAMPDGIRCSDQTTRPLPPSKSSTPTIAVARHSAPARRRRRRRRARPHVEQRARDRETARSPSGTAATSRSRTRSRDTSSPKRRRRSQTRSPMRAGTGTCWSGCSWTCRARRPRRPRSATELLVGYAGREVGFRGAENLGDRGAIRGAQVREVFARVGAAQALRAGAR